MPVSKKQVLAPLNKIQPKDIELLYRKTVIAVVVIASAYIIGIIFFTVMFLLETQYSYMALLFPLFAVLWLNTLGAKHVNNRYGFKKTRDGTIVYIKKQQNYSTFISLHTAIFLVSSIVRFIYEVNNLLLIRKELCKVKIDFAAEEKSIPS